MTRISSRARFAPRQKCVPWPNARCGIGIAADVEPERIREHVLVAVRGRPPQRDLVAGRDRVLVDVDRSGGGAAVVRGRRRPSQDLLDGRGQQGSVVVARAGHWSQLSMNASTPTAIELRVVSVPAATSSVKNICCSSSVRHVVAASRRRGCRRARVVADRLPSSSRRPYSNIAAFAAASPRRLAELAIVVVEHCLGPREQLVTIVLRHAHQPGDRLQGQLGRHLDEEVARALVDRGRRRSVARARRDRPRAARAPSASRTGARAAGSGCGADRPSC